MNKDFIEIVDAAKSGDNRAFEALYNMTRASAYFIAFSITNNEQDALDILQDSYIKAFSNIDTVNPPETFDNWFNRIVSNKSKDWLKKKKPILFADINTDIPKEWKQEELDRDNIPHEAVDSKETSRLVMEIIDKLSEDKRLVILMYYYQDMSVGDISEILELPVTTVKYKLLAARKEIKKGIEDLEKKGTKLYSVTALAILPAAFALYVKNSAVPAFADVCAGIMAGVGGQTLASAAGETALGASVKGKFLSTVAGKIVAAVAAAAIVIGGAAAVIRNNTDDSDNSDNSLPAQDSQESTEHIITKNDHENCEFVGEDSDELFSYSIYSDHVELSGYKGEEEVVTIPSEYDGKPVVCIESYAFKGCDFITGINIPDTIIWIEHSAFSGCNSISDINFADSVISVENNIFEGTEWYNSQPDGMIYLGKIAYGYKGEMPENTTITIADGTRGIAGSAFAECSGLAGIEIPDSVMSIGISAFQDCTSLADVHIPDAVTEISQQLFYGCSSLTGINIPDGVTTIGALAFSDCTSLTSVNFPESVTTIGAWAFNKCSYLESVTIPDSVTTIGEYAFESCSALTAIDIPDSVTYLGESSFKGCSALTKIDIPGSITSIEKSTFEDCESLVSVTIPDSVTTIAEDAFYKCSSLTDITIPESVINIDPWGVFDEDKITIHGKAGSVAESYAEENEIQFVAE